MILLAESDLAITKRDSPIPVRTGEQITYTLSVSNASPDAATGVSVIDALPTGVTFGHASAGCVDVICVVTCNVGILPIDGLVLLTSVVISPAMGGSITNTVTLTG